MALRPRTGQSTASSGAAPASSPELSGTEVTLARSTEVTARHAAVTERAPRRLARLEKLARTAGTGFLFALFGVGGVLLATLVIPLLCWVRGGGADRELRAQRVIHHSFRWFTALGSWLRLLALEEHGTARLRAAGQLVIANHPSLLDVVYLISRMPQADCVVKREAWSNPFFRPVLRVCGYIPNTDGEAVIAACAERLARGRSVLLFPEGSRSPSAGLGRFQRGVAHIALASGCPITPVWIECRPRALVKGQPWYALPNERLRFSLRVGGPVFARDWLDPELPRVLAARRVTAELRSLFETEVSRGTA
jgi:1-acyl-sn-glycerol-3-phosphate acyltransferase